MQIRVTDNGALIQAARKLSDYAARAPAQIAADLNTGGAAVRQAMVAAETKQTGLKAGTIGRALVAEPATPGKLSYAIRSSGGSVSLKYFGATETGSGVTAAPWGMTKFYAGAFIRGGRPGARVPIGKLGGHAYARTGSGRLPIEKLTSGLRIPEEMTKGETLRTFEAGAAQVGQVIVRRLGSIL